MARITVNVDTETHNMQVLVNGQSLTNVREVIFSFYEDWDGEVRLNSHINMVHENPETGLTEVNILSAHDFGVRQDASEKTKRDIEEYFSSP